MAGELLSVLPKDQKAEGKSQRIDWFRNFLADYLGITGAARVERMMRLAPRNHHMCEETLLKHLEGLYDYGFDASDLEAFAPLLGLNPVRNIGRKITYGRRVGRRVNFAVDHVALVRRCRRLPGYRLAHIKLVTRIVLSLEDGSEDLFVYLMKQKVEHVAAAAILSREHETKFAGRPTVEYCGTKRAWELLDNLADVRSSWTKKAVREFLLTLAGAGEGDLAKVVRNGPYRRNKIATAFVRYEQVAKRLGDE